MAFCSNCGNEISEGTKFCPNCGAQIGEPGIVTANANSTPNTQNITYQQTTNVPTQPMPEEPKSGLDRFGKLYGIALLILAIVDYNSDPPIVTIILSIFITVSAIFCLRKKYKLKGFTIIALVIALFCLMAGIGQAGKYGLFTIPKDYEYSSKSTKNQDLAQDIEEKETNSENDQAERATNETESSIIVDNDKNEEPVQENNNNVSDKAETTGGVDPDLKAFLDSYEQYIDQYVEFMKKYNSDPNNMVSMLGEYGEMMQKYADFAEKLEEYDSDNMSTEDYKYYIEVTTRCSQKMLEAY